MKLKFFLPLALVLLVSALGVSVSAASTPGGDYAYLISVSSTNFLPSTMNPGDIVSLSANLTNNGTSVVAGSVSASLDLGSQFEGIQLSQDLGDITPGASNTAIFKFKVKEDTLPGYYPAVINLSYTRNEEPVTDQKSILVAVSSVQKKLDISVTPDSINPGNQSDLVFSLKNLSGAPISNVSIQWVESSGLVLPLGTDNKRFISSIGAGETAQIGTTVAADPNITPGVYTLDFNIVYSGSNGAQSQDSKVGIIVGGKTDFEVSADFSNSQVSLSIANIGSNNAGAVVVKIPAQAGVRINGSSTAILGNINKGDFTLANFQLAGFGASQSASSSDSTAAIGSDQQAVSQNQQQGNGTFFGQRAGNFDRNSRIQSAIPSSLLLEIDYTDTTGARQKVEKTVPISVSSSASLAGFSGRNSGSSPLIPIVLLALIVGGFAGFNAKKSKKSWNSFAKPAIVSIVLFLIAIFLFNSGIVAILVSAIVSVALMAFWISRKAKESNKGK